MVIATALGVPIGIAVGRSAAMRGYLDPLLHFARAIPPVALAPVFIVVFKLGTEMELATIVFGTIWPLLLNTADGARSIDPLQVETVRAFQLTAVQRLIWLIIPGAFAEDICRAGAEHVARRCFSWSSPNLLEPATDSVTNSLTRRVLSTSPLCGLEWSGIVLLGILGYVLNVLLLTVERRMLSWHSAARRPTN